MADKPGGVNEQVKKHFCTDWFKSRHLQKVILPVLLLLAVMSISDICIASASAEISLGAQVQQQDLHQPIRVRIFTLRNITTRQAEEYLAAAQITDTVLAIPGTTAISVTGSAEQLVYASTVIKLVDANERFNVWFLDMAPGKTLPAAERIEAQLGKGYSVGSLLEGPFSTAAVKTVVCAHKDKLLIIAPEELTNRITETVQSFIDEQPAVEPNQQDLQQPPDARLTDSTGSLKAVASANDVAFAEEPLVIEPNAPVIEPNAPQAAAPVGITAEPNRPEDDMLSEFLNELAEAAKAEKEILKIKTEPNQPPQTATEIQIAKARQEEITEQRPVEEQMQGSEQKAEKIQEQSLIESRPTLSETEQMQEADDSAQQPATEERMPVIPAIDIPNGDEVLELNLPEKLEIVALIDLVGKYLNLNYLYDETKVTGSVTIKVQGRLRVRELYDLLESVLKFRGFVMSRKGKLVTIAPAAEALDQDPAFAERVKAGDVVATNVFHLQYITTATAKRLLGEMKLGSNITEIPETGTIVITEYSFRMQRIEDLLSLIDVPGPPREFRLRVLNYTLAEGLVPKIQALAEQLGTVEITVGGTTPSPAQPPARGRRVAPQPQQTPEAAKKTGVYIDFDKRTNRILMIGLANEVAAVEQIVDSLDVPQQDLRTIREYEIQFVDIDKVIEALKELGIIVISGGTQPTSKAVGAGQPPAPAAPAAVQTTEGPVSPLDQPQIVLLEATNSLLVNATPEQHIQISRIISYIDREPIQAAIPYRIYRLENQEPEALAEVLNNLIEKTIKDKEGKIQETIKYTEEDIAIVPDKNTFSLIVYASKKNQEWIGNLIQTLDKRRPQVLIDVSLVEITRDDSFQYDLDVIANATSLVQNNIGISSSSINSGFPSYSPQAQKLEAGYFAGTTKNVKGFFNEGRIQALFNLIDEKGYGRILARPKVLVNDNEEGVIATEDTRYIALTTTVNVEGVQNAVQTNTTYNPYTAKIELKITPQISEGDLLRLEITMERNDFQSTSSSTGGPPNEKKSSVSTIVTVPDGSTIILGGLTKLNQTKGINKVPLLGDIPIAGALFRSVSKGDEGNKLYIFVKANILRPEETEGLRQLENISRANRIEFERAESQFQNYELFPSVKEEPMEPEKVLEQEIKEPNEI